MSPANHKRIISGLKETFIKRYIVERTNQAEIRPEEQSEKAENCQENVWNETQLKGPLRQKQTQEENKKRVGKLGWFMSKTKTATSPPREGEPAGTYLK